MLLYQFVNSNRDELILRCREKVKKRFPPIGVPAVLDHGVPLFLRQLVDALQLDPAIATITDLAVEKKMSIDTDEFRTLNRCLDDAIAAAVTAFGNGRKVRGDQQAEDLHQRLNAFADEQRRLVDMAIHAYSAIRTGSIGATGSTGALLVQALGELRILADRSVTDIRLASAMATLAPH